jgi:ribose transport system ATP-binding protein
MASPSQLLHVSRLSKTFPAQRALKDVSLSIAPGEVYGLVGHNGSGKSTLIKTLARFHEPDPGGRILLRDKPLEDYRMAEVRRWLHFIHQDLGLISSLDTVENLAISAGYSRRRAGLIDWRRQRRQAAEVIEEFGGHFNLDAPVGQITPGDRAIVAIARAFMHSDAGGAVLVLDEPTAALHPKEVDKLFHATRAHVQRQGAALFVSHRLEEVFSLADRVGVLREGVLVAERPTHDFTEANLIAEMLGHEPLAKTARRPPQDTQSTALAVSHMRGDRCRSLSFETRAGRIVGITGLDGSGREEVADLLFGVRKRQFGSVSVNGARVTAGSPRAAARAGMRLVPADRSRSVFGAHTAQETLTLAALGQVTRRGLISKQAERRTASSWMDRFEVRPSRPERPLGQFSGGNQQKVILASRLVAKPAVLVLDDPTNGVDIGAKAAVQAIVSDAAADGIAVVISSSDADDLASLCDEVLVLRDGVVKARLRGPEVNVRRIVSETLGQSGEGEQEERPS